MKLKLMFPGEEILLKEFFPVKYFSELTFEDLKPIKGELDWCTEGNNASEEE